MPLSSPVPLRHDGERLNQRSLRLLHLFLLGGAASFLVSGFLSDWAYFSNYEIQWKNFASWLIIGGLVFGGFALLWALIALVRADQGRGRRIIYSLLLLTAWILGFIDELIHAKDAWGSMPDAIIVSAIVAVLAIAAAGLGFSIIRAEGR